MQRLAILGLIVTAFGQDLFLKESRPSHAETVEKLRQEIHTLTAEEAAVRFAATPRRTQPPSHQDKIEHFVVLYMENHAFDHYLGCMDLPGADGIPASGRLIPKDPTDPKKGFVNVTCGTADYVCAHGPGYTFLHSKFKKGANYHTYPYDAQSDDYSYENGAKSDAIKMFGPEQLPVKYAMAKEFGVFNKMYTASPTMSWPNHMFSVSGTSCGCTSTGPTYAKCGGNTTTYPQLTMFDVMKLDNVSFGLYANVTGDGKLTDDMFMAGVIRHKDNFFSHKTFYNASAEGTLPAFSFVQPPPSATDHPCHDVARGERLHKDVYEALRAGPGWNKTLFLVVYDDGGGYYDHMVPPFEGVPAPDAPCNKVNTGCPTKFDFRRLGLRTTGLLMSPWVAKGSVFQEPKQGPTKTSQFELTSIVSTAKKLFNLTTFLTKRDAWAATFDELLLDTPRADTPAHLPEAPPPAQPWNPPLDEDSYRHDQEADDDDEDPDARRLNGRVPQHCSAADQTCHGHTRVNTKQLKNIRLIAELTQSPAPDTEKMSTLDADRWLEEHWELWTKMGGPVH